MEIKKDNINIMDFLIDAVILIWIQFFLLDSSSTGLKSYWKIIDDSPLGKVKYHAIRVEFQVQGSPHIYSFLFGFLMQQDQPKIMWMNIDNLSIQLYKLFSRYK